MGIFRGVYNLREFPLMALPERFSTTDLARLFMVSPQNIQNYIKAGMPKHGHGKTGYYVWEEVFPWYRARLQDVALKSVTAKEAEARLDGAYEQALKTKVERERHELKLARERAQLVEVKDVKTVLQQYSGNVKARVLAMPGKLARRIGGCKNDGERKDMLMREARECLDDLVKTAGIIRFAEEDESS
jgi:phage terminase Nu1 subunit (DNA packaging protein)